MQQLKTGAGQYAQAEATIGRDLLDTVNAPTQALVGRPLIGNGAAGVAGGTLAQANGAAGGAPPRP